MISIDRLKSHVNELHILINKIYMNLDNTDVETIRSNLNLEFQITGLKVYTDLVALEYDSIMNPSESDH